MAEPDRHARQRVLPGWGDAAQDRIAASSVLIIGAGGLGSPAAMYLTAAGVGRIGLVDDDVVDLTNLQRQILHGVKDVGRLKVESGADRLRGLDRREWRCIRYVSMPRTPCPSSRDGTWSSMGPIESVHATSSTTRVRSSGSHGFTPPSFGSRAE